MTDPNEFRLLQLLDAVRGQENPEARLQLNEWLRSDPEARQTMARLLVDEHALISKVRDDGLTAILNPAAHASPFRTPTKGKRNRTPAMVLTLAAAASICLWFAWMAFRNGPSATVHEPPVAILTREAHAIWQSPSPASGGTLGHGPLRLLSGMAALEFTSGTRILLEGPAELVLHSEMRVTLVTGRVMADVPPPAHGFTIETPSASLVDRGTRFGVNVAKDGATLVKVITGKVDLKTRDEIHALPENRGFSITPAGKVSEANLPDDVFPSDLLFTRRSAESAADNSRRWNSHARMLSTDPSSLLHFHFEETSGSSRSVMNHAFNARAESNASIVGTRWTEGRWPDSRAADFSGRGDRMLFKLRGTAQSTTCLTWLRVDSLSNSYHILLMPDASNPCALQWMIDSQGNLRMAITNHLAAPAKAQGWEGPVKAPAISNLDLGRWIFLASTYDSASGKIIHYRDGEIIGSGVIANPLPIRFGSFSLGNWPHGSGAVRNANKGDGYRNFIGRMDELAILSRAMSPEEIRELHQAGKP